MNVKHVRDRSAMRMSFEDGVPETHRADALRTDGKSGDAQSRELLTDCRGAQLPPIQRPAREAVAAHAGSGDGQREGAE
jgi:hypothetical protein